MGDSLAGEIDRGLASCQFGVVILSEAFFSKSWPQRELDGLVTREVNERVKRILPVWHNVGTTRVSAFSPTLAGKLAAQTRDGIESVVDMIVAAAAKAPASDSDASEPVAKPPATHGESSGIPAGYEQRINFHRWRIARDSASEHPSGGYEFPVLVKGTDLDIRAFKSEYHKTHGVREIVTRFWDGYGELEFTHRGKYSPEIVEALAIKHRLNVAQCGKPFSAL